MNASVEKPGGRMAVAAGILAAFAVAGVGLVAFTELSTRERIAANERAYLLRALNEVVPAEAHDNDMFSDTVHVSDEDLLGTPEPVTVFRAFSGGQPAAVILTPIAPDGYSGTIRLLVGIAVDGRLTGVRVTSHRETPGLGDGIEAARSDWILGFNGRSLDDPPRARWTVRRDGGDFDQFTGATITPRAVVKAVRNALLYFEKNGQALFVPRPENSGAGQ